jgi:predicted transcriptional regulator
MPIASTARVKDVARRIVERLPEDATWDDLRHAIEVCETIEAGLKDSEEGRTVSHEEVRKMFGLDPA